jgi:hypothetical protein
MSTHGFQQASYYAHSTANTSAGDSYPEDGGLVMTPYGVGYAPPKGTSATGGSASQQQGISLGGWLFIIFLIACLGLWFVAQVFFAILSFSFML